MHMCVCCFSLLLLTVNKAFGLFVFPLAQDPHTFCTERDLYGRPAFSESHARTHTTKCAWFDPQLTPRSFWY